MIRKPCLFLIILGFSTTIGLAQSVISPSLLFARYDSISTTGKLNIVQDPAIDTLMSRYILINENLKTENLHYGMWGHRIQIYASSNRNARDEANKANAEFLEKFPDLVSYILYAKPGYFKVRVGDYRTKTEAMSQFLIISKEFPDAYLVPDFINFPVPE
jgi:hypothetical protein